MEYMEYKWNTILLCHNLLLFLPFPLACVPTVWGGMGGPLFTLDLKWTWTWECVERNWTCVFGLCMQGSCGSTTAECYLNF